MCDDNPEPTVYTLRMVPAMPAAGDTFDVGVDENNALFVDANGVGEVVGNSGAVVVDNSTARFAKRDDGIESTGVRVSYFESSDRIDLHRHKVSPSTFKLAGKVLDHKASDFKPV